MNLTFGGGGSGGMDDSNGLQQDLDRLAVLGSRWDMEFNPSRCQVFRMSLGKRKKFFHIPSWTFLRLSSARYMGVDISLFILELQH